MNIVLPNKLNSTEQVTIDSKSIIVIGANGAGKTRFGSDIEARYNDKTHRISAQKSLSMPESVSPTSKENAEKDFLYGYPDGGLIHKIGQRWGSKPNTFLLNDYQKLMVLLHTEEYEASI
ncbi:MAG: AAA family ATPase, partial [Planctomycetes bacterium]|nr:AAA family ATPase [Planctomycetota bacterium]